jgi:hypothetical protein
MAGLNIKNVYYISRIITIWFLYFLYDSSFVAQQIHQMLAPSFPVNTQITLGLNICHTLDNRELF